MDFLWSFFNSRRTYRHYASVDSSGICRAFKQCRQQPEGHQWVEITEQRLSWLGQPLPATARVTPRMAQASALRLRVA